MKNRKPSRIRPAFKTHGGKYYLSPWIISLFPENYQQMNYLEPFCGGASVLLNKLPSPEESVNDLDTGVTNVLRIIRDEPKEFVAKLRKTKYCEGTFTDALENKPTNDFDSAINEFILRRMSRGGLKKAFAWSNRERGGQPGDVNAWETMLDLLPVISTRLHQVHIFNKKALQVIEAYNDANIMLYCDPPYLHETRESKDAYKMEMSEADHIRLSDKLKQFRGKVIISGYPSELYDRVYDGWRCEKKMIVNHSSQQKNKQKKTELAWMNY